MSTAAEPAQPPPGYRWATPEELDRPDAVLVPLTVDSQGTLYTGGEADLAVPLAASGVT